MTWPPSEPVTVWGVWHQFWDTNELIGLYWTEEEADAKAKAGGKYRSLDYRGMPRWHVEEHAIPGEPPSRKDREG